MDPVAMDHALVFPDTVDIDEANIPRAVEVYKWTSDNVLSTASDSQRLRCPSCLGRLIPERHPAVNGKVRHFRHHPQAPHDCPFRNREPFGGCALPWRSGPPPPRPDRSIPSIDLTQI